LIPPNSNTFFRIIIVFHQLFFSNACQLIFQYLVHNQKCNLEKLVIQTFFKSIFEGFQFLSVIEVNKILICSGLLYLSSSSGKSGLLIPPNSNTFFSQILLCPQLYSNNICQLIFQYLVQYQKYSFEKSVIEMVCKFVFALTQFLSVIALNIVL
jgi:hypothetical protein